MQNLKKKFRAMDDSSCGQSEAGFGGGSDGSAGQNNSSKDLGVVCGGGRMETRGLVVEQSCGSLYDEGRSVRKDSVEERLELEEGLDGEITSRLGKMGRNDKCSVEQSCVEWAELPVDLWVPILARAGMLSIL